MSSFDVAINALHENARAAATDPVGAYAYIGGFLTSVISKWVESGAVTDSMLERDIIEVSNTLKALRTAANDATM